MKYLRRLDSPSNPLNFFRIILSNDIKTPTIRLPEKFTEIHGGSLLDSVTLKVPNGDVWQVDLIKSKGKLCFNNGWMEFAMHYGITFGNLLVFKYEGFSIFNVLIFDPTACEIVYPKKKCILGHKSTQVKTRKKLDSCKKIKFDDLKPCSSWDQDQNQVTEIKITGECSSKMVDVESNKALEAARARYKSDKPFFMVYMTPHHIAARTSVHVPFSFLKEHWSGLKKDQKCVLKLGRKTWETRTNKRLDLRVGGWKMLMKEYGISASDVCVFELIDSRKNLLQVSIIRAHVLS